METSPSGSPTVARIAANVRAVRKARGMTLATLSERLGDLGRPISVAGLSKMENGVRGVDADDLVTLALALGVTPNRLLLPPEADEEPFELTPGVFLTARAGWEWASGEEMLLVLDPRAEDPAAYVDILEENVGFRTENRPHDPPTATLLEDLARNADVLEPVYATVQAARARGLSVSAIASYVEFTERLLEYRAIRARSLELAPLDDDPHPEPGDELDQPHEGDN